MTSHSAIRPDYADFGPLHDRGGKKCDPGVNYFVDDPGHKIFFPSRNTMFKRQDLLDEEFVKRKMIMRGGTSCPYAPLRVASRVLVMSYRDFSSKT